MRPPSGPREEGMSFRVLADLWSSHAKAAWRSIARNRTYTFINLIGLTLGLAASLIILVHVRYELGYDAWLPEADRAFVLQQWVTGSDDPNVTPGANPMTSYVSGERLRQFSPARPDRLCRQCPAGHPAER
jgi:putative ABC transport system permease protein